MDKAEKDFLINDELERHLESMYNALGEIGSRQESKVVHRAGVIMMSALIGVFANCQSWNEVADFSAECIDFIRKFFPDIQKAPSHDTLRRFFCLVCPNALERRYRAWALNMRENLATSKEEGLVEKGIAEEREKKLFRQIAIDGMSIKKAMNERRRRDEDGFFIPQEERSNDKLHIVSAFSVDDCLSLGQERVDKKENEIVAIPRLLDDLDISEGDVVTIDAMGTQKDIVSRIVKKRAGYLLEVKKNQATLWETIAGNMRDFERIPLPNEVYKVHKEGENGHGFVFLRECRICSSLHSLGKIYKDWENLRSYGLIVDEGTGESAVETHYFISSLENDPEKIMRVKRKHWGIKNGLHWQLDITFKEDDDRKRKNSAQNFSLLNKMSLTILKAYQHKDKRASIKRKRMMAAWHEDCLYDLITRWIYAF